VCLRRRRSYYCPVVGLVGALDARFYSRLFTFAGRRWLVHWITGSAGVSSDSCQEMLTVCRFELKWITLENATVLYPFTTVFRFLIGWRPMVRQSKLLSFQRSFGYNGVVFHRQNSYIRQKFRVSFHLIIYVGHENRRSSGGYYECICPVTKLKVKIKLKS